MLLNGTNRGLTAARYALEMRYALLAVLIAACSESESPHDITDCTSAWDGAAAQPTQCERACSNNPTTESGYGCAVARNPDEPDVECVLTFELNGERGCCGIEPTNGIARYYRCE